MLEDNTYVIRGFCLPPTPRIGKTCVHLIAHLSLTFGPLAEYLVDFDTLLNISEA